VYKPMSEAAKQAAREAIKMVLQRRYPGTVWRTVPEGEKPSGAVFRIDSPAEAGVSAPSS
jgi:hypothetical protein